VITPIDGFRKNLESQLPDLEAECAAKVASLEQQLHEQREALAYVRGLAAQAGVQLKKKIETGASVVAEDARASSETAATGAPALQVA
jgi:hypothetical protein